VKEIEKKCKKKEEKEKEEKEGRFI